MMTYTTTADAAAIVRNQLKAKGINSRMVSVRADNYSMGSALRITIKSADVSSALVREIAEQQEKIDRCSYTGEILSGGNRFVTVSFSSEAREALAARYLDAVTAAVETLKAEANSNVLIPIDGTDLLVGTSQYGDWSLWRDGHLGAYCGLKELSMGVAVYMQKGPD